MILGLINCGDHSLMENPDMMKTPIKKMKFNNFSDGGVFCEPDEEKNEASWGEGSFKRRGSCGSSYM
jgi:hypothetical protein